MALRVARIGVRYATNLLTTLLKRSNAPSVSLKSFVETQIP